MEEIKEHTIAFQGLKDGRHQFKYELEEVFLKATGVEDFLGGKILAVVDVDKNSHLLDVRIHLDGNIRMLCDHCNAPMDQAVLGDQRQIFKLSGEDVGEDDELVAISPDADSINLTHYFFECLSLHLPIRHVHPAGKCDPEVEHALDRVLIHPEPAPDPRWAGLQALKNKEN
jgi:uncharacterized protein